MIELKYESIKNHKQLNQPPGVSSFLLLLPCAALTIDTALHCTFNLIFALKLKVHYVSISDTYKVGKDYKWLLDNLGNFRQKLLVAEILLSTREKLGMKEMEGVTGTGVIYFLGLVSQYCLRFIINRHLSDLQPSLANQRP